MASNQVKSALWLAALPSLFYPLLCGGYSWLMTSYPDLDSLNIYEGTFSKFAPGNERKQRNFYVEIVGEKGEPVKAFFTGNSEDVKGLNFVGEQEIRLYTFPSKYTYLPPLLLDDKLMVAHIVSIEKNEVLYDWNQIKQNLRQRKSIAWVVFLIGFLGILVPQFRMYKQGRKLFLNKEKEIC